MSRPESTHRESFFTRQLTQGFRRYVRRFVRRNFNAVRVANSGNARSNVTGPLICFMNHPSWWDPMVAVLMTDHLFPGRQFAAPMDAAALKQYPILERLGFFALHRESMTGLKDFLRICRTRLSEENVVLWVTPTGQFSDVRESVPFKAGLSHIAGSDYHGSLVAVAVEYSFWNERCPEMLIEFGPVLLGSSLPEDKSDRTAALQSCLAQTQASLSRKSIARDPAAFTTISLGRAGIGGIYDWFRRFAAVLRGSKFQGRHESTSTVVAQAVRSESS
jgi:1-acyl-sn-glycerol-3-phosphate acyltransferase